MFVDIVGASEVSNNLTSKGYADFVGNFQELFLKTCDNYIGRWLADQREHITYEARGDEGIFMAYPPASTATTSTIVDIAIHIALELKRRWIIGSWNKKHRIDEGILPTDIAVGIHTGVTYLRTGKSAKARPEGYAINLAKRVESSSRTGVYTRIFVSEAAHGALNHMADEAVYIFDEPRAIEAKGFSREVRAFEIMHHFLPTDWSQDLEAGEASRSRSGLEVLKRGEVETVKKSWDLNPTNIWLAEEYIRSSMLRAFEELSEADSLKPEKLRDAFEEAHNVANYLAQGDQQDTGILMIQGLIDGECFDFAKERERYDDGRKFAKQIALLEWYDGYSYSNEAYFEIGGLTLGDNAIKKMTFATLQPSSGSTMSGDEIRELIRKAKQRLRKATDMSPWSAWIAYTYGCELVQWAENETETELGVFEIVRAVERLEKIRDAEEIGYEIANEQYLLKVLSHEKIKDLIS